MNKSSPRHKPPRQIELGFSAFARFVSVRVDGVVGVGRCDFSPQPEEPKRHQRIAREREQIGRPGILHVVGHAGVRGGREPFQTVIELVRRNGRDNRPRNARVITIGRHIDKQLSPSAQGKSRVSTDVVGTRV